MLTLLSLFADNFSVTSNAKLPNDKQIRPLPDFNDFPDGLIVRGRFITRKVLTTNQDKRWKYRTFQVSYKVVSSDQPFPYKEIIFIVKERLRIRGEMENAKPRSFHFRPGEKEFLLVKEPGVDYYTIVSYTFN